MADDYDFDVDEYMDMDDGWLYVEDEFDLADELAEGQFPNPGYCGTNYEIDMDSYEFDLFAYWEDLEYADDAYWDYGRSDKHAKRKRGDTVGKVPEKRMKTTMDRINALTSGGRDAEPLLFCSREERNKLLEKEAPPVRKGSFAFLADWRERFVNADGVFQNPQMPADMKRAAEGQGEEAHPGRNDQLREEFEEEAEDDNWEDEDEDEDGMEGEDAEGGLDLDPEMLKTILREKLGAAGLDGMDEQAFMRTIQKMISGDEDAAGELTDTLLGKVTSGTGNEAVSGWLSQQGVALENHDDDASSVATASVQESSTTLERTQGQASMQMPLHSGSPSASSRKRGAPTAEDEGGKKQKKVKFDFPSSSSDVPQTSNEVDQDPATDKNANTEDDNMDDESTLSKATAANAAAANGNRQVSQNTSSASITRGRKRKTTADETSEDVHEAKKTRSRELRSLGPLPEAPPPAPPSKRTRSARAKNTQ